jgi:hypothetical protein
MMGNVVDIGASAKSWLETLVAELKKYNFNYTNEDDLQRGILEVFMTLKKPLKREYRISDKDRIDFYWPEHRVGVEVKIDHALSALTRQVHRYVQHEDIQGILVVTGKVRLNAIPAVINKKPVYLHSLATSLL